jgi:hypothetical protein
MPATKKAVEQLSDAVTETDTERAFRYRNSAEHIRIDVQSVEGGSEREVLLRIAADFETLADDIQRASKSANGSRQTAV